MRSRDANDILREDGADALRRAIDEHPYPEAWFLIENHRVVAPRMLIRGLLPYKGIAFVPIRRRQDFRIGRSRRFAVDEDFIFRPRGSRARRRRLSCRRGGRTARQPALRGCTRSRP
jgi:hypothetical protein